MTGRRIGSLCSGYGGLDMAASAVLGADVAWHCQYEPPDRKGRPDRKQHAARILAHRWPGVPNHGDITRVDWHQVAPVAALTAGFPCQDVSAAGHRAGIAPGTRSGVWAHVAHAVAVLRPGLVFIENVEGLLSAKADRGMAPADADVAAAGEHALRALGCVLGDLADLGFDARWCRVRASDLGACHQRSRVFVLAWPAHAGSPGLAWRRATGATSHGRGPVADADGVGGQRDRARDTRRDGPADHGVPPADTPRFGRDQRRSEPAGQQRGPDVAESGSDDRGPVDWGPYAAAVTRAETFVGRRAGSPTDPHGRLNPVFVEWMMGLPAGHVTAVPGIPRSAQLKALGNGVVPQQATHALRMLLGDGGSGAAA
ncbi:DNA cytosine methyltransferase [Yinghuangia sp. YIM S10712]|uniref:DNA cytosine methyltransferase n=1 Tax=Yinghuangia sp. YIM S10712 TaxID=3436930 RepID=UPI003F52A8A6